MTEHCRKCGSLVNIRVVTTGAPVVNDVIVTMQLVTCPKCGEEYLV